MKSHCKVMDAVAAIVASNNDQTDIASLLAYEELLSAIAKDTNQSIEDVEQDLHWRVDRALHHKTRGNVIPITQAPSLARTAVS